MALIPFLLNEFLEDLSQPTSRDLPDQHFGLGLINDIFCPAPQAMHRLPCKAGYMRPWRHTKTQESGVSSLVNDKHEFKVNLDVQQFKPEELKVTIDEGYIVVNGKHEERQDDHGYISRQFTRKYKIPEDVDQAALVSKLSSDGVLSLQAPKKVKADAKNATELPITLTNQPMKIQDKKDPPKDDSAEQKMEMH